MKLKTALAPAIALVATVIVADDATPEVALPELPSAPVLQPARTAAPAKPAQTAKPTATQPATPKPGTAELDLSASKVLSAETEDGKPVYVVFQKEESEFFLFRENIHGGLIGTTYLNIGGGVLNAVGSKEGKPKDCSGSYLSFDVSLALTKWMALRVSGLSLFGSTVEGTVFSSPDNLFVFEDSDFAYSYYDPMLVLSVNSGGVLNPYAGVGCIIQSASIKNSKRSSMWTPSDVRPQDDINSDCSFFAPTVGLEINIERFGLIGECTFAIGAETGDLIPFLRTEEHSELVYGGGLVAKYSATDNLSLFAEARMTQAVRVFGGGVSWRF